MSKIFVQLKVFLLLPLLLSVSACTTMSSWQNTNGFSALSPNPQSTGNMLLTPNEATYYYPIQFGHVDINAKNNDVYTPVYEAPLAIYPHYQRP